MERSVSARLLDWASDPQRRPLILRGARQVGKTWLVRDLARRAGLDLVELNFERDPRHARPFAAAGPREVLGDLSLMLGREVDIERSLLFLDEVQSAPTVLESLRWFAEEMPQFRVIAAGSLLDFALGDHDSGMPVGRVGFLHLQSMGFDEYLRGHKQSRLLSALAEWKLGRPISTTVHEEALEWFRRYTMVGGMPAVVAADVSGAAPRACRELQRDLVAAFRADFAKYSGRMDREILDHVLDAVARSLGRKFVYAHVGEGVKQHQAKRALELLAAARLCSLVTWSAGTGLPLGGETKDRFRKAILLDVGIFHALAGTPATERFPRWEALASGVRGQLAEQLVGQALRLCEDPTGDGPRLFTWWREGGRPGEVDYLIQAGGRILPVELKSGASGAMKSLHQFMFDKRLSLAVRIDENPPSLAELHVKTTQGDAVRYRLLSLPPYLAWRTSALAAGLAEP